MINLQTKNDHLGETLKLSFIRFYSLKAAM